MTSPSPVSPPPSTTAPERYARWVLIGLWGSLALTAGPVLADALDPRSRPVQVVASVILWLGWAVALGATLVPRTVSLTVVRVVMPAAVPAVAWSVWAIATDAAAGSGGVSVLDVVALGTAVACVVVVLSAFIGDQFVNGSSYGDERRMPLRPPGALLLGPIPLAWALCVAGAVAGPLLLAAEAWVAGTLLLVVGWVVVFGAARALHALCRRWIVFVPAGFVLHDAMALAEPLLMQRRLVANVGPALAGTRATDFTVGALGLALQVDLAEPVTVTPLSRSIRPTARAAVTAVELQSLLFAPTRPGAVLAEARRRRIPVGAG
jgi:hypothetical protein